MIDLNRETEGTAGNPKAYAVQTDPGEWAIVASALIPEQRSTSETAATYTVRLNVKRRSLQFVEEGMLRVSLCSSAVARITFESAEPQVFLSRISLANRDIDATMMEEEPLVTEQTQPPT